MKPLAVVFTYMPDTGECFATPFDGDRHSDPLGMAHAFREVEEMRGDFPGSLWAVTGNDEAAAIRSERRMLEMFGDAKTGERNGGC